MSDYRLELFWSIFPYKSSKKGSDYRLELFWSIFPSSPLRKGQITDWSCSEAFSITNPSRRGQITDYSCTDAFSPTNPLRKGRSTDWSCSEAFSSVFKGLEHREKCWVGGQQSHVCQAGRKTKRVGLPYYPDKCLSYPRMLVFHDSNGHIMKTCLGQHSCLGNLSLSVRKGN